MKKVIFLFLLIISASLLTAQNVTIAQAKETLKSHFISLEEARTVFPDLPLELKIPYTLRDLKNNKNSWLLPIPLDKSRYYLIQANFECESSKPGWIRNKDTLSLVAAKKVIMLLNKARLGFPNRVYSDQPYKYFFRTKTATASKYWTRYKKTVTYYNGEFLIINWPNSAEFGVVNDKCLNYLVRNKRGKELQLGTENLPDFPVVPQQSIYVLTLTYLR
jgi:hypothetical protein